MFDSKKETKNVKITVTGLRRVIIDWDYGADGIWWSLKAARV